MPVELRECKRRGGTGEKRKGGEDACGKSGDENGREEGGNMATHEQAARGGFHTFVFAGFGVR